MLVAAAGAGALLGGRFLWLAGCRLGGENCSNLCLRPGMCWGEPCTVCRDGTMAADCSGRCANDCSGRGICVQGEMCVCSRRFVGADCSVPVAELLEEQTLTSWGVLEDLAGPRFKEGGESKKKKRAKLDPSVEIHMNTKSTRHYVSDLCTREKCNSWVYQMAVLNPHLPREDVEFRYKTCAVVSSARALVYAQNGSRREGGWGHDIDNHKAVFRLDNAPIEGVEQWVGSKTTHRIVQADYGNMVGGRMGTRVKEGSKEMVNPGSWWKGGYPEVEKVTYLLATPVGDRHNRAAERNLFMAFKDIFPGSRKFILSPFFMKRVWASYAKMRDLVREAGLGCHKGDSLRSKPPRMYLAVMYSLQVCDQVEVYGLSTEDEGIEIPKNLHARDNNPFHLYHGPSPSSDCCYHEFEDGFVPTTHLCDEMTRRHALRLLARGRKITLHP